jgi:ribosomal protein L32
VTGHSFKMDHPAAKIVGRAVCSNCGLMRLRNALTDWCVAKGCDFREHPGFAAALRTLPAQHRQETTP